MKNQIKYCKKKSRKEFNYLCSNEFDILKDYNKTIFDIDFADWKYQKKNKTIVRDNYDSLYMPHINIEAFVRTKYSLSRDYVSGNIESARSYLFNSLLEKLENELNKKFPTLLMIQYKKLNNKNTELIFEHRSCGFELEYKKIYKFLHTKFIYHIDDYIVENVLKNINEYTFIKTETYPVNILEYKYIIGDIKVAKQITLKSFFQDFEKFQQPIEYLYKIEKKVFKKLKKAFLNQMLDILNKKDKLEVSNAK